MAEKSRFRYSLQPVLLRRQWDLDALKLDLSHLNESIEKLMQERIDLQRKVESVAGEWKTQSASASSIVVERFSTVINYMNDLARQAKEKSERITELESERESLIDRIAIAQKSLEAMENHRDEMRELFLKQRLSTEFKLADDHWSTLHAGKDNHDH